MTPLISELSRTSGQIAAAFWPEARDNSLVGGVMTRDSDVSRFMRVVWWGPLSVGDVAGRVNSCVTALFILSKVSFKIGYKRQFASSFGCSRRRLKLWRPHPLRGWCRQWTTCRRSAKDSLLKRWNNYGYLQRKNRCKWHPINYKS